MDEQNKPEQELAKLEINLNQTEINEFFLRQFGGMIELLLKSMFGGATLPVSVRGTREQVRSFTNTLGKEKKYLENYMKHGLNDPQTYKSKYRLNSAIEKFEKATKLKWPFK